MTPCMTPDEWALWQDANGLLKPHQRARRPCSDCPASFAVENRAAGTCDGHPYGMPTEPLAPLSWHEARALPELARVERYRARWRAYRARVERVRNPQRSSTDCVDTGRPSRENVGVGCSDHLGTINSTAAVSATPAGAAVLRSIEV